MDNKRFVIVYQQGTINRTLILADTETGVHYLYSASGYGGGLTVLLDENGKPVIKKPTEETET